MLFVAGPIAEVRLTGRSLDPLVGSVSPHNDWFQVKLRYDALQPDVDLEELIARGLSLVDRRWREIEFVATALVEHLRLTALEVLDQMELARVDETGIAARSFD